MQVYLITKSGQAQYTLNKPSCFHIILQKCFVPTERELSSNSFQNTLYTYWLHPGGSDSHFVSSASHMFLSKTGRCPVTSHSRFFHWFLCMSGICLVISRITHFFQFYFQYRSQLYPPSSFRHFSSTQKTSFYVVFQGLYPFWWICKCPKQSSKGCWLTSWRHTPVHDTHQ